MTREALERLAQLTDGEIVGESVVYYDDGTQRWYVADASDAPEEGSYEASDYSLWCASTVAGDGYETRDRAVAAARGKAMTTTREAVETLLAQYWMSPRDYWDETSRRYRLSVETEYDDEGELISEDVVESLRRKLPDGWTADWTGQGNGDEEDLTVYAEYAVQERAGELIEDDE